MTLPNFYILGAQKCGTSWLACMLRQHPDVYIPPSKEINYFNRSENFIRGRQWYETHFEHGARALAIGDATPQYLAVTVTEENAKVIERLLALTPDAKFIVSLRNPVTRAVSGVLHDIRVGRLSAWTDLDDAFRLILAGSLCRHVLEYGRYLTHIRSYLCKFSVRQFHFLIYEQDIQVNRRETLRGICEFLGVREDFEFQRIDIVQNPAIRTRMGLVLSRCPPRRAARHLARRAERAGFGKELSISGSTAGMLRQFYAPDSMELGALIGRDLNVWRSAELPGLNQRPLLIESSALPQS